MLDPRAALRRARRLLVVPPAAGCDELGPALVRLRIAMPQAMVVLLAEARAAGRVAVFVDQVLPAAALTRFDATGLPALVDRLAAARLDAALVFTAADETAFEVAYLAYLAGIPVRAGFADEFGGGVLAPAVPPPPARVIGPGRHLSLLDALDLSAPLAPAGAKARPSCDDSAS
ncbi:hypothetical protein [Nannocystis bainbridge]|uniref:Uncharacterized protein n=1 Tax=Nannocystis bainbridge TaxID=2995303 RepID=A0ABT5DPS7_9BACT|nr:hypothetical protein [Nannocystis bainbridge]MDC0715657.1 hypothetical protein [Nannocystis bainbridge]